MPFRVTQPFLASILKYRMKRLTEKRYKVDLESEPKPKTPSPIEIGL